MPYTSQDPVMPLWDGKSTPALKELSGATITVGAEAGSTINVAIQLNDGAGKEMTHACVLNAYIAADAAGQTIASAYSSSPAIGTDGLMNVLTTDVAWMLTSEADGDIDIDFIDTGTDTNYLVLVMPNGRLVISDAITHT